MGPYTKRQDSDAIDNGWTVCDGNGETVAHLGTETMADCMMDALIDGRRRKIYAEGTPYSGEYATEIEVERRTRIRADFIRRLSSLLDHEDVFGYSLQRGRSVTHGNVVPVSRNSVVVRLDGGDILVTVHDYDGGKGE